MELLYKLDDQKCFPLDVIDAPGVDRVILSLDEDIDELIEFLEILNRPVELVSDKYKRMKNCLNLPTKDLFYAIPASTIKSRLNMTLEETRSALETPENKEYLVTYLTIKRFLRGLSRAHVSKEVLSKIISETENENVANRLRSFLPKNKDKDLPSPKYCMSKTATGRLTITQGPQVLTLNASARKIFKSRFVDGKVLQIDLVAAEPNIALRATGNLEDIHRGDVYQHISKKVFDSKITREVCKLVTLSVLYGQSSKNLEKRLPKSLDSRTVIRKTRDFFNVKQIENDLYQKLKNKNLRNILGRPLNLKLEDTRLCLNYYLQSSTAEISILLFSEWLSKQEKSVVPLFVIHDALIVDCKKDLAVRLLEDEFLDLNLGDWSLKAKVTQVSDI